MLAHNLFTSTQRVLGVGLLTGALALGSAATAQAASPFNELGGTWSGSGRIRLANGDTERLRCRAYYTPRSGGSRMGMAIRCSSPSYNFELRSTLTNRHGRVSGDWQETNFNASGSLRGRARNGRISLRVDGSVNARLTVSYGANRQTVSLQPSTEGGIRHMQIGLRRRR